MVYRGLKQSGACWGKIGVGLKILGGIYSNPAAFRQGGLEFHGTQGDGVRGASDFGTIKLVAEYGQAQMGKMDTDLMHAPGDGQSF